MDFIYFGFALFVFLLLIIVVILTDRLKRSRMKDGEGAGGDKEKERKLFLLYQNLEDLINSTEEYAEETKDEMQKLKEDMESLLKKCELIQESVASSAKEARDASRLSGGRTSPDNIRNENAGNMEAYRVGPSRRITIEALEERKEASVPADSVSVENAAQDDSARGDKPSASVVEEAKAEVAKEAADDEAASPAAELIKKPKPQPKGKKGSTIDMVYELIDKGYDEEKIAQELSLSRGEVSLIIGLYKK